MIAIVAKQKVKNEEIETFIEIAKKLVKETHKYDEGCIHYDLFQDKNNPQIFTFIEKWENQDALNKHMQSDHFKKLLPQLEKLRIEVAEVDFYTQV